MWNRIHWATAAAMSEKKCKHCQRCAKCDYCSHCGLCNECGLPAMPVRVGPAVDLPPWIRYPVPVFVGPPNPIPSYTTYEITCSLDSNELRDFTGCARPQLTQYLGTWNNGVRVDGLS